MLKHCAGHMDLMSEHFYCHSKPDLAAHVRQIPDKVRRKVAAHRDYRKRFDALKGKDIRIALDEWNYWYGPDVFGEIGTRYFLRDALGIAAGLNEMARSSDMIFMANYAQTVNVIGCIKTSKTAASFETTGLVLKLYRKHFGVLPVATQSRPARCHGRLEPGSQDPDRSRRQPEPESGGDRACRQGGQPRRRRRRGGRSPETIRMAFNDPGKPAAVGIDVAAIQDVAKKLSVAPCSVTLFALPMK